LKNGGKPFVPETMAENLTEVEAKGVESLVHSEVEESGAKTANTIRPLDTTAPKNQAALEAGQKVLSGEVDNRPATGSIGGRIRGRFTGGVNGVLAAITVGQLVTEFVLPGLIEDRGFEGPDQWPMPSLYYYYTVSDPELAASNLEGASIVWPDLAGNEHTVQVRNGRWVVQDCSGCTMLFLDSGYVFVVRPGEIIPGAEY
jgi:hypothetical protein